MTVASKKDTQVWLITGSSRGLGRALAEGAEASTEGLRNLAVRADLGALLAP